MSEQANWLSLACGVHEDHGGCAYVDDCTCSCHAAGCDGQDGCQCDDPECAFAGRTATEKPAFVTASGAGVVFVNVYDVTRHYGGPEEGGWWYDAGEPILTACCSSREEAEAVQARYRAGKYAMTRKRYSVLGGLDYDVRIEDRPGYCWPGSRPHYE